MVDSTHVKAQRSASDFDQIRALGPGVADDIIAGDLLCTPGRREVA
jgi:hypothetical protein